MVVRRILFFDSKSYDERTFKAALRCFNGEEKLRFTFLESKLNEETVTEAQGYDGICIVNSDARNSKVIDRLHELCPTVKIIALRSAGHSGSSVEIVKKQGLEVCRVPNMPSLYFSRSIETCITLSFERNCTILLSMVLWASIYSVKSLESLVPVMLVCVPLKSFLASVAK
jgi:hypothetical protein